MEYVQYATKSFFEEAVNSNNKYKGIVRPLRRCTKLLENYSVKKIILGIFSKEDSFFDFVLGASISTVAGDAIAENSIAINTITENIAAKNAIAIKAYSIPFYLFGKIAIAYGMVEIVQAFRKCKFYFILL